MSERNCPWCAEPVAEEARKCPHCGSGIDGGFRDPRAWHRDYPDRKVAGVCSAVADNLNVSVSLVRAGFVLLSFFHLFGVLLYAALWFVIPRAPGSGSGVDRVIDAVRTLLGEPPRPRDSKPRSTRPSDEQNGASDGWSPTRN